MNLTVFVDAANRFFLRLVNDDGLIVADNAAPIEGKVAYEVATGCGGSGGTPTLAEVLAEGADASQEPITGLNTLTGAADTTLALRGLEGANGDGAEVALDPNGGDGDFKGGIGTAGNAGGAARLRGGSGNAAAASGAEITAGAGNGTTTPGRAYVYSADTDGISGQALVSDGNAETVWGGIASGSGAPANAAAFAGFLPLYRNTANDDLYILVGTEVVGPYSLAA